MLHVNHHQNFIAMKLIKITQCQFSPTVHYLGPIEAQNQTDQVKHNIKEQHRNKKKYKLTELQ